MGRTVSLPARAKVLLLLLPIVLRSLPSPPRVVAIHNPESPAARYYLRAQRKTCGEAGVPYDVRTLEPGWDQARVLSLIRDLNRDPAVTGITVHTPLPAGMDQDAVMSAILPTKDIEGIHPENLGRLAFGVHWPAPCAARWRHSPRPTPRPPPVTTAALPSRMPICCQPPRAASPRR